MCALRMPRRRSRRGCRARCAARASCSYGEASKDLLNLVHEIARPCGTGHVRVLMSFPKDSTPRKYFGSPSELASWEHKHRHPAGPRCVARHANTSMAKHRAAPCPSTTSRSSARPRSNPAPAACMPSRLAKMASCATPGRARARPCPEARTRPNAPPPTGAPADTGTGTRNDTQPEGSHCPERRQ